MKKTVFLALIFIFGLAAAAFAETSIKAEVDKTEVSTDNVITYKITVSSSEKKIPVPELPDFKGFRVISQAQSSSFNLVKGEFKTSLVYVFLLLPVEAGDLVIGPASVKAGDDSYSAQSFTIKVAQGKILPHSQPEVPQGPKMPESEGDTVQFTL